MAKLNSKKDISSLFASKNQGVKIDLGGGGNSQKGFINVDIRDMPGVDIVQDLQKFPWSDIPDNAASLLMASHLIEHINPADGIFMKFMDECWRILKPGGQFMIALPYAGSPGFWQDPTHVNGCNEMTWEYFDPIAPHAGNVLYNIYKPLPWKVASSTWDPMRNMEVLLEKRLIDKSYGRTD